MLRFKPLYPSIIRPDVHERFLKVLARADANFCNCGDPNPHAKEVHSKMVPLTWGGARRGAGRPKRKQRVRS